MTRNRVPFDPNAQLAQSRAVFCARSACTNRSPTFGICPFGRNTRLASGHWEKIEDRVVMYCTRSSSIGNPSASSIAGCITSAKVFVPNWSSAVTQASSTAGTVAESGPVEGINPGLAPAMTAISIVCLRSRGVRCVDALSVSIDFARFKKNSRVAFFGAWPIPSMTATSRFFNLIRMGTSPPKEKCENSITDAARIVATPASTALPPFCKIRRPASTESG